MKQIQSSACWIQRGQAGDPEAGISCKVMEFASRVVASIVQHKRLTGIERYVIGLVAGDGAVRVLAHDPHPGFGLIGRNVGHGKTAIMA